MNYQSNHHTGKSRLLVFGTSLLLIIGMLMVNSCKSPKEAVEEPEVELTAEKLIKEIKLKEFNAESIDGRARIQVGLDGMSQSFRGHIRAVRDSAIWVRATVLGFEVGRAMITPDTFQLIDRVNREYMKMPLDVVAHRYGLDVTFKQLEQLLTGSPSFDDVVVRKLDMGNPGATIAGFIDNMQVLYKINGQQLVERFTLMDGNGRVVRSDNNQYKQMGDAGYFAWDRQITGTDGVQEFYLNCEFLELNVEDVPTLPFDVPSRYDRIE
ncbi:MAG: DUF4292 domain-containing protein [Saprospirales bacterium]|nr:MAG: DUF4292 domain-containing protein [Saprospirales bacterium]